MIICHYCKDKNALARNKKGTVIRKPLRRLPSVGEQLYAHEACLESRNYQVASVMRVLTRSQRRDAMRRERRARKRNPKAYE